MVILIILILILVFFKKPKTVKFEKGTLVMYKRVYPAIILGRNGDFYKTMYFIQTHAGIIRCHERYVTKLGKSLTINQAKTFIKLTKNESN